MGGIKCPDVDEANKVVIWLLDELVPAWYTCAWPSHVITLPGFGSIGNPVSSQL